LLANDFADQLWFRFILVGLLGFFSGMELRAYIGEQQKLSIGTSRTYTFIALFGFVLFELDPNNKLLYLAGFFAITVFFALFYAKKLSTDSQGILQILLGLITYSFGPMATQLPLWFLILVFVSIVFVLNARPFSRRLSAKLDQNELQTLAKFLLLAAVILPLLPNKPLAAWLPVSAFKIWLAVVVMSSISYFGYLLNSFWLKERGYLVAGLLGGFYSSTTTTVVLARKTAELKNSSPVLVGATLAATAMMYLRLLLLVFVFRPAVEPKVMAPLLTLGLLTMVCAGFVSRRSESGPRAQYKHDGNPLDLGAAFVFAGLFVVMLGATQWVLGVYGLTGLKVLSFLVGFSDIDPFVVSLLSGHYAGAGPQAIATAIVIAAGSNNFLKAVYARFFGSGPTAKAMANWLIGLGCVTVLWGFLM